jgi:hypothetical protein
VRYAPWVVTNLYLSQPLTDRGGAAPAWDNVLYPTAPMPDQPNGGAGGHAAPAPLPAPLTSLGYVSATHQQLSQGPGPTVLTHYRALGDQPNARQQLLDRPWTHWRDQTVAELQTAHPELGSRIGQVSVSRYGHGMVIPTPGLMRRMALWRSALMGVAPTAAQRQQGRLAFAHSDWAGYSVFEEAFTAGHLAAGNIAT